MDGKSAKNPIYKNKKINIARFDKLFKVTSPRTMLISDINTPKALPIVPLFGDMHVSLLSFVQASPNYDASKWTTASDDSRTESEYNIISKLGDMREQRDALVAQLALVQGNTFQGTQANLGTGTVYDIALHALRTVSSWTAIVRELVSRNLIITMTDDNVISTSGSLLIQLTNTPTGPVQMMPRLTSGYIV